MRERHIRHVPTPSCIGESLAHALVGSGLIRITIEYVFDAYHCRVKTGGRHHWMTAANGKYTWGRQALIACALAARNAHDWEQEQLRHLNEWLIRNEFSHVLKEAA